VNKAMKKKASHIRINSNRRGIRTRNNPRNPNRNPKL